MIDRSIKIIRTALIVPVQSGRIIETVKYYANGKSRFGVLSNGTCFFPSFNLAFSDAAKSLLDGMESSPLDFKVREMDDGNFIVAFSEHVFSVVYSDEFSQYRLLIEKEAKSLSQDESILGDPNAPRNHFLIGLYARTRLLKDMEDRNLAETIQAEP
jgi:hypothetical protein